MSTPFKFPLNEQRELFPDLKHDSTYGYDDSDVMTDCIWVEFLERVRDEIKFSSAEKLVEQLEKDKSNCLSLKYKYELGEKDAYN